jgi:predicted ArsR family transcriptional regulator
MILQQLQIYLREHSQSSLAELSQRLQTDRETLRQMLNRLIRKGRVKKCEQQVCGGCKSCDPATLEFYEWVSH